MPAILVSPPYVWVGALSGTLVLAAIKADVVPSLPFTVVLVPLGLALLAEWQRIFVRQLDTSKGRNRIFYQEVGRISELVDDSTRIVLAFPPDVARHIAAPVSELLRVLRETEELLATLRSPEGSTENAIAIRKRIGMSISHALRSLRQRQERIIQLTVIVNMAVLSSQAPRRPPSHDRARYDVFISYRRTNGLMARLIQAALAKRFHVFLDVDELTSGAFDERLISVINETPHFILLLSDGALERCCTDPEDWITREVGAAIEADRNIVPVMVETFTFPEPERLPERIRGIQSFNAVPYSHVHFNSTVDKVIKAMSDADPGRGAEEGQELMALGRSGASLLGGFSGSSEGAAP